MFVLDGGKIASMSVHDAPEPSQLIVTKETFRLSGGITLESGATLPEVDVAYERYGDLNADKSNVVLIAHGITGSLEAHQLNAGELVLLQGSLSRGR